MCLINLHTCPTSINKYLYKQLFNMSLATSLKAAQSLIIRKSTYTHLAHTVLNPEKIKGSCSPLIILHGLFGSQKNWQSLSKSLCRQLQRQVITVDLRNHGESFHSETMTYGAMSDDIKVLLKEINVQKCIILGHSMGGKAAMTFALKEPSLVERLIVEDISPVNSSGGNVYTSYIKAIRDIQYPEGLSLPEARALASSSISETIQDRATRDFILTNLTEKNGKLSWKINLNTLYNCMEDIMVFPNCDKQFYGETLFIKGLNSNQIREENEAKISELFPNSKIEGIPDCGHWCHAEKPKEFSLLVRNFLKS